MMHDAWCLSSRPSFAPKGLRALLRPSPQTAEGSPTRLLCMPLAVGPAIRACVVETDEQPKPPPSTV